MLLGIFLSLFEPFETIIQFLYSFQIHHSNITYPMVCAFVFMQNSCAFTRNAQAFPTMYRFIPSIFSFFYLLFITPHPADALHPTKGSLRFSIHDQLYLESQLWNVPLLILQRRQFRLCITYHIYMPSFIISCITLEYVDVIMDCISRAST